MNTLPEPPNSPPPQRKAWLDNITTVIALAAFFIFPPPALWMWPLFTAVCVTASAAAVCDLCGMNDADARPPLFARLLVASNHLAIALLLALFNNAVCRA